jgi:hypothetical protein
LSCPAQFSAESTTFVSHAIRPAQRSAMNESQRLEVVGAVANLAHSVIRDP